MNVYAQFKNVVEEALQGLVVQGELPANLNFGNITVEPPRDASHGDLATNAALVLAKQAKMNPRQIASLLAPELAAVDRVVKADIAGPGFINITLDSAYWQAQVQEILKTGLAFGDLSVGGGKPVNIEYVSANPTGPMHVGHVRGAVFGDALANLLQKAGHKVTKEYYINDAGGQIDVLARSVYLRYQEAFGQDIGEIPEGLYPGDYLIPVGQSLKEKYGDKWLNADEAEWLPVIRTESVDAMMALIKDDLAALGVEHEVFFSEVTLHQSDRIAEVVETLTEKGHMYQGVLEPPKGQKPDDWEAREQTLFRATDFGDDVDRALQKSNGDYTYFGADIAYHLDKMQRGFKEMINVWGADHGGYVKRMQASIKALDDEASLDVRLCQLVRLFRDGEPVKMSKRSGNFVTLREVVDEVGRDVTRFIMLTRKNDAPLDFDFTKVMEQSKDNPVFYVQYAHARICSVLKKAVAALPDINISDQALADVDLSELTHSGEIAMIKQCCQWPRLVESAASTHEPHRVAFYLYDLASEFHGFWNQGHSDPSLRFIIEENPALTTARLALIRSVAIVIASGLAVLGVKPVEEMR